MNDTTSYLYHMTGGMPTNEIWAGISYAMIGLILMTAINVRNGMQLNPNTSRKFNLKDFGFDSTIRVLLSALITWIVIFISIRFVTELTGQMFSMFYAFGIGTGIDKATQLLTKKKK